MERASKGLTLADGLLADLGGPRTAGLLDRLEAATPWDRLAQVVKPLYRNDTARGGRPNVPIGGWQGQRLGDAPERIFSNTSNVIRSGSSQAQTPATLGLSEHEA